MNPEFTAPRKHNLTVPEVMATVGPTLEKPADLQLAIKAGARWFRLPCGYRQRPHVENALAVRAASSATGIPVKLLLDLPSSRPRTGNMAEARLAPGDHVLFWDPEAADAAPTQNRSLPVPLPGLSGFVRVLVPKQRMWFCDGRLDFVVEEISEGAVLARLAQGQVPLKSSNSLFLPDSPGAFTAITPADRELLAAFQNARLSADWIALSLISSPEDVRSARAEICELLGPDVLIMAKFETLAAVECAEDILEVADGLMVARGDLGLAIGYGALPGAQEELVELATQANKPAVVATQVLEVFAETGLPQRAELTDLAVMARQQVTAVMLGKETVYSPRPIDSIRLAREVMTEETRRLEEAWARREAALKA